MYIIVVFHEYSNSITLKSSQDDHSSPVSSKQPPPPVSHAPHEKEKKKKGKRYTPGISLAAWDHFYRTEAGSPPPTWQARHVGLQASRMQPSKQASRQAHTHTHTHTHTHMADGGVGVERFPWTTVICTTTISLHFTATQKHPFDQPKALHIKLTQQ